MGSSDSLKFQEPDEEALQPENFLSDSSSKDSRPFRNPHVSGLLLNDSGSFQNPYIFGLSKDSRPLQEFYASGPIKDSRPFPKPYELRPPLNDSRPSQTPYVPGLSKNSRPLQTSHVSGSSKDSGSFQRPHVSGLSKNSRSPQRVNEPSPLRNSRPLLKFHVSGPPKNSRSPQRVNEPSPLRNSRSFQKPHKSSLPSRDLRSPQQLNESSLSSGSESYCEESADVTNPPTFLRADHVPPDCHGQMVFGERIAYGPDIQWDSTRTEFSSPNLPLKFHLSHDRMVALVLPNGKSLLRDRIVSMSSPISIKPKTILGEYEGEKLAILLGTNTTDRHTTQDLITAWNTGVRIISILLSVEDGRYRPVASHPKGDQYRVRISRNDIIIVATEPNASLEPFNPLSMSFDRTVKLEDIAKAIYQKGQLLALARITTRY
jgi:hypothetical protein